MTRNRSPAAPRRRSAPSPSAALPAAGPPGFDPRHFDLDGDETLLPHPWRLQVRRVRTTARQDLRKLLDLEPEARRPRVEETESRLSFRSHALAGMLLEESRARVLTDAADAALLADVAASVLHWIPGPPGERWRQGAAARALAHRANAWRCAGELAAAEADFQRLHARAVHERQDDPRLTGEAASWEAALRWRQGDPDAALELLAQAADAHRQRGARRDLARVLGRWADVLRAVGRLEAAVGCLDWAASVLEPAAFAAERRRVLWARGQVLVEGGRLEEARRCLAQAGEGARRGTSSGDRLEWELGWLAGRLGVDGAEAARRRLVEVRRGLSRSGRMGEAALVAVDEVLVGQGGEGERTRAAKWLERRVLGGGGWGGGVGEGVGEWVGMVVRRLGEGEVAREVLVELRRGVEREVVLAGWGAE